MTQYQTKLIAIEALQYKGNEDSSQEIVDWAVTKGLGNDISKTPGSFTVDTPNGTFSVLNGNYVLYINGSLDLINSMKFDATYELPPVPPA